jgi:fucose permease
LLTALVALAGVGGVLLSPIYLMALVFIFITGLGAGNMFPVIFSLSLEKMPDRANEISGLLIMAISGGAVIPPVVGLVSTFVSPIASMFIIGICMLYVLWVSFYVRKH